MYTNQLANIMQKIAEARGSKHVRIIVNGVAFPIKQAFYNRNDVTYLIADTNPNKGDIVGMPPVRQKR